MTSPKPRIGFFTPAGKPIGYVSRGDPFVVIATVPGKGKPPTKITVPVGDEELELTLDPTAPVPTYISEPTTMAELGVDADHGETATATVNDAAASVEVHHNHFEASFAQLNEFLNQQMKFWTTFLFNLQSEESDDPDVQLWIETAKTKISLINRGRIYLNDERQLATFRLEAGTYYAGRVRGAVSSPSMLQFWATYGRNTLGGEQDIHWINRLRFEAKDAAFDSLLGLVGGLLLGLYEEITDATFAGPMYQLITGENIRGREASRGTALLELAFGAALEVLGFKLGKWLSSGSRRAWSRPDPDAPKPRAGRSKPKPRQGTDLIDQDLPSGTPVHPRDAGMTEAALAQLQHVGRKHGVTFVLRPANKASLKWQEKGFPYKPMAIKQKTIQEIDHHIGAPRRYDGENTEGLVGFFDPKLPSKRPAGMSDDMWGAVQERFKMRKGEWDKLQGDMKKLEDLGLVEIRDGMIIDTGLSEFVRRSKPGSVPGPDAAKFAGLGTGKPITGDYDLFSIVKNGRELSDVEAAHILEELKDVFVKIQHGSNRAWRAGDKYAHVKTGIEFDHTGKDTEMYKALTWHLEGKHTERLHGLSSANLRKEALAAKVDVAGKTDDELIGGILDAKGWRAKSKGEALIVVVPEPGATPIAYWHGHEVPEGTFKKILDQAGVKMSDITRHGFDANGQAIIRALIFSDETGTAAGANTASTEIVKIPAAKTAEELAADAARSARFDASQQLNAWWADTSALLAEQEIIGEDEDADVEAETIDGPTAAEITAHVATGAIPERFKAAAARDYLIGLTDMVDGDVEITDADVERYLESGKVPEALEGAAAEHAAEQAASQSASGAGQAPTDAAAAPETPSDPATLDAIEEALAAPEPGDPGFVEDEHYGETGDEWREDVDEDGFVDDGVAETGPTDAPQPAGVGAGQTVIDFIKSLPDWVFWVLGGAIGLFVLITALSGGGTGDEGIVDPPQAAPTTEAVAAAGGGSQDDPAGNQGGGGGPGAAGAPADPALPPDTEADKLMVVDVGGALLPIHQFMVTQPHAPEIIITFSGEDDLNVFPDFLVFTDDSYEGDPVTACRDPHFHMPEFMPTGMDIEGDIIPEPNAQGCGYGRLSEAFPIRVPKATSDAWEDQVGWDPRTGEPLVELTALFSPFVTDAAQVDLTVRLIIENVGQIPWSTVELNDEKFGAILGANASLISNDCMGPIAVAPFEKKKCTYGVHIDRTMTDVVEIASATGEPGINEIFTTSVNIVVEDEDGERGGDVYVPVMYFAAHFAELEVEKTSDPQTLDEPGPATFTITIRNNGTEALELVQVLDTEYGNLLNEANPRVVGSDCPDLPPVIQSNQEFSCTFIGEVGSNTEDGSHLNEVFVTVVDPAGNLSAASADLRIPIAEPGPVDTSGMVIWELFVAEGVIDSVPEGVVVGG